MKEKQVYEKGFKEGFEKGKRDILILLKSVISDYIRKINSNLKELKNREEK